MSLEGISSPEEERLVSEIAIEPLGFVIQADQLYPTISRIRDFSWDLMSKELSKAESDVADVSRRQREGGLAFGYDQAYQSNEFILGQERASLNDVKERATTYRSSPWNQTPHYVADPITRDGYGRLADAGFVPAMYARSLLERNGSRQTPRYALFFDPTSGLTPYYEDFLLKQFGQELRAVASCRLSTSCSVLRNSIGRSRGQRLHSLLSIPEVQNQGIRGRLKRLVSPRPGRVEAFESEIDYIARYGGHAFFKTVNNLVIMVGVQRDYDGRFEIKISPRNRQLRWERDVAATEEEKQELIGLANRYKEHFEALV